MENARLTYQAELAEFYFELHGLDSEADLLQRTEASYRDYLQLTKDRFNVGIASGSDVAQAQTQLATTDAQLIDLGVLRAQYEHAIAILVGKPPSEVTMPSELLTTLPPPVPAWSALGIARNAVPISQPLKDKWPPRTRRSVSPGLRSFPWFRFRSPPAWSRATSRKWFTWPSRFWSLGPAFAQPLFEGGRLHAQLHLQEDTYDATVASYRQTVLTAFQQVEDNMAALRVLENEAQAEDTAVKAAQESLDISTAQYKAGTADYLQVITSQGILLADQSTAVNILTRRLTSSVLLIEALGGGWDASQVPSYHDIVANKK